MTATAPIAYRGRFAPSPTGPLHFGSLVAALGSYLEAKTRAGRWLLRIEDLDTPRVMPGAADAILRVLEAYGFEWDETVTYQSQRNDSYLAMLDALRSSGALYGCACSRREIEQVADGALVYPGTCRSGLAGRSARAWRVKTDLVDHGRVSFTDAVQGEFSQHLPHEVGDFVVLRADGLFAYQLAVVADDAAQGITDVVRGADLLDSTPRQIYLQRLLGLPTPRYAHLPLATNARGEKLGKQTLAPALDTRQPLPALANAWRLLGQTALPDVDNVNEFWRHALLHWRLADVPRRYPPTSG
ncbi:MAG: tRNA glutamyl-Q(34) synthetase GluQRS [Pseudomonadota bacterium]